MELFEDGSEHGRLTKRAVAWLLGKGACKVAGEEVKSMTNREIPDAIGFNYKGYCTIIECKASRADFLADKKKDFRARPERGMGVLRYFMVPAGLVAKEEVPEGWGLIYVYPKTCRIIKQASPFSDRNTRAEFACMVKMMREQTYEFVPVEK